MIDKENVETNAVAVLKLVTNETVVSEIVEENDDFIVLKQPLVINSIFDRDGEPKIAYRVWMPYNKEDIVIVNKSAIVALCVASEYYSKNYKIGIKEMLRYRKEELEESSVEVDTNPKEEARKDLHQEDNVIFLNTDKSTVH